MLSGHEYYFIAIERNAFWQSFTTIFWCDFISKEKGGKSLNKIMQRRGEKFLMSTKDIRMIKPRVMLTSEYKIKWSLCKMRNAYKFLVWNLKKSRCSYWNFNWMLKKCDRRLWPGSDWLRVLSFGGNFRTLRRNHVMQVIRNISSHTERKQLPKNDCWVKC